MKFMLDTRIFIALLKRQPEKFGKEIELLLASRENELFVSVATLWEMSIKWRLKKLDLIAPPEELPVIAAGMGLLILPITESHAVTSTEPEPPTRDPFDRLLLAQCQIENMRLVTIDRALIDHPLSAASFQK